MTGLVDSQASRVSPLEKLRYSLNSGSDSEPEATPIKFSYALEKKKEPKVESNIDAWLFSEEEAPSGLNTSKPLRTEKSNPVRGEYFSPEKPELS
jgi:hypothetical protein